MSVAFSLPAGIMYDMLGPRTSAVIGALTVSIGMLLLSLSIASPTLNGIAWPACILCDCAGTMASMAVYGFVWHLPQHQTLLATLFAASFGVSTWLVQVAVWLVEAGVSPHYVWFIFSGMALVSSLLLSASCVSRREFHACAAAVTGSGSPTPPRIAPITDVLRVLRYWARHPLLTGLFSLYTTTLYCTIGTWAAFFVPLMQSLLPPAQAKQV
jgi:hypothetical protein